MEKVLSVDSHSLTILQFQQEVYINIPHTSSEIKLFERNTQAPMGHQKNGCPILQSACVFQRSVVLDPFSWFYCHVTPDGEDISLGALSVSQSEAPPTASC